MQYSDDYKYKYNKYKTLYLLLKNKLDGGSYTKSYAPPVHSRENHRKVLNDNLYKLHFFDNQPFIQIYNSIIDSAIQDKDNHKEIDIKTMRLLDSEKLKKAFATALFKYMTPEMTKFFKRAKQIDPIMQEFWEIVQTLLYTLKDSNIIKCLSYSPNERKNHDCIPFVYKDSKNIYFWNKGTDNVIRYLGKTEKEILNAISVYLEASVIKEKVTRRGSRSK